MMVTRLVCGGDHIGTSISAKRSLSHVRYGGLWCQGDKVTHGKLRADRIVMQERAGNGAITQHVLITFGGELRLKAL
jgi:hypothetical protein